MKYLDHYRLTREPFGVTPDPEFLYLGTSHQEALASLFYGFKAERGLSTLIAPPGMGKTTLLFRFLEYLRSSARTAFLFQTQCDSNGLLHYFLKDLGVDTRGQNFVEMHDQLNSILADEAANGNRCVLVIDEAQNLEDSVLETARLLTDFETPTKKLLHIVFAGQPQLKDKLRRPELLQLRQRISVLATLEPFGAEDVSKYIHHRLRVAGHSDGALFSEDAINLLTHHSGGIPRNINNLCFHALSLGFALRRKAIDSDLIEEVAADLEQIAPIDANKPTDIEFQPKPKQIEVESEQAVAVEETTCTPVASNRFFVANGTALIVLESVEDAQERNADILAELSDDLFDFSDSENKSRADAVPAEGLSERPWNKLDSVIAQSSVLGTEQVSKPDESGSGNTGLAASSGRNFALTYSKSGARFNFLVAAAFLAMATVSIIAARQTQIATRPWRWVKSVLSQTVRDVPSSPKAELQRLNAEQIHE